jgi:predicted ATPase
MLKSITISGYRTLQDSRIDFAAPLTAIVGRNNVGKSNFFKALQILSYKVQLRPAAAKKGSARYDDHKFKRDFVDGISYKFTLALPFEKFDEQGKIETSIKDVTFYGSQSQDGREFDVKFLRNGKTLDSGTMLLKYEDDPESEILGMESALELWRFYQFEPTILRLPSIVRPAFTEVMVGSYGEDLAASYKSLKERDPENFKLAEELLQQAIPEFVNIDFRPATIDSEEKLVLVLKDQEGREFEAETLSDGALRFLAIISLVYAEHLPSLIFIEEPENGVHPGQLEFIVELLRAMTRGKTIAGTQPQVLITSHSPYLVDQLKPKELVLAEREADRTLFYPIGNVLKNKKVVKRHLEDGVYTLGAAWSQGSFTSKKDSKKVAS